MIRVDTKDSIVFYGKYLAPLAYPETLTNKCALNSIDIFAFIEISIDSSENKLVFLPDHVVKIHMQFHMVEKIVVVINFNHIPLAPDHQPYWVVDCPHNRELKLVGGVMPLFEEGVEVPAVVAILVHCEDGCVVGIPVDG